MSPTCLGIVSPFLLRGILDTAIPEQDMKLLSLLEYQLTAADLRLLARVSRRTLDETRAAIQAFLA